MKKTLILILFSISTILIADSELANVEKIIKNSRPADLPAIAGNYSALGSTHQIKGDYTKALENYRISSKEVKEVRERFPFLKDRRNIMR